MQSLWQLVGRVVAVVSSPRHTKEGSYKHAFVLSSSMQHLRVFGIPIAKLRLERCRRCRGQLPDRHACDGETHVALAICMTNLSGHPWRPRGSS